VLAIAAETNSVLLMDDLAGRRYAHSGGLPVVGTLGLLEIAARKKLTSLKESISRLQQTNIRIAEELYLQILERNPGFP
jgi:predicted nucleic acid-binding protein